MMRSPPILQQSDEDAEAAAASARRTGTEIVRSHLENHASHNPGRSSDYVSWIATLHPENADVTIDQRFLIPGNPWWTVYEETKHAHLPSAVAVEVTAEETGHNLPVHTRTSSPNDKQEMPHFCMRCSPIDMFCGIFIAVFSLLFVGMLEVTALAIYLLGALFYHMARPCDPSSMMSGCCHSIFMLFYWTFAMADSLLLVSSVLVTETLAICAWLCSICIGGWMMANMWHQYVRRVCHACRWACRSQWSSPPRHLILCCAPDEDAVIESKSNITHGASSKDREEDFVVGNPDDSTIDVKARVVDGEDIEGATLARQDFKASSFGTNAY